MLDPRLVRHEPETVREGLAARGVEVDMETLTRLEAERRELIAESDRLKRERNEASRRIAERKKRGEDAAEAIEKTRAVAEAIKGLDAELDAVEERFRAFLVSLPNLPDPQAPVGSSEEENVVRESWGEAPEFDFEPKEHVELGESLGLIDLEAAARLSGSGFALFIGDGARLVRGLIAFMIDLHVAEHGYTEVWPPALVRPECMMGTGQLPKMEEDMYRVEGEGLYLIPTAEVPVTNIHREQILDEEDLPISYVAYTPCFRREAGAHGAETRGLVRMHQFDKVEMVRFCRPEESPDQHQLLLGHARTVLERLGLTYRVLELCTGDLSFAARRCYDLELWAPASERWLEVSSCSDFGDFQARRAGIRYRRSGDEKVDHLHTLNASGVALPRLIVTLLETFQTDEGTVRVPEVLQPYVGGLSVLKPARRG
ncbi:MAG: serine--tRNA ligase [bacterium]